MVAVVLVSVLLLLLLVVVAVVAIVCRRDADEYGLPTSDWPKAKNNDNRKEFALSPRLISMRPWYKVLLLITFASRLVGWLLPLLIGHSRLQQLHKLALVLLLQAVGEFARKTRSRVCRGMITHFPMAIASAVIVHNTSVKLGLAKIVHFGSLQRGLCGPRSERESADESSTNDSMVLALCSPFDPTHVLLIAIKNERSARFSDCSGPLPTISTLKSWPVFLRKWASKSNSLSSPYSFPVK